MRILLVGLALLPAPAAALEYCEDLWFTRNLIFHKAGYCFGSALGQAVFGNGGCTGTSVTLDPEAAEMVALIREEERISSCAVDTSRTSLPIPQIDQRIAMIDPPMPSLFESACIGWLRAPLPLYAARDSAGPQVGQVERGDTLLFQFEDTPTWSFVEVVRDEEIVTVGWGVVDWSEGACENYAG